jgi:hypothetical protein
MTAVEEHGMKRLLKTAVAEVLAEGQDLLRDGSAKAWKTWPSFEPFNSVKNLRSSVARKCSDNSNARHSRLEDD